MKKVIKLLVFVVALSAVYVCGIFFGKEGNIQKICGDCPYTAEETGYQACVGEYIVFECKKGDWVKTYERKLASNSR